MVDVGRAYEIVVSEKRGRGRPLKGLKAVAIRKINVRSTEKGPSLGPEGNLLPAIMKAIKALNSVNEASPIKHWSYTGKVVLADSLRPLAEQYVMLGGKLP